MPIVQHLIPMDGREKVPLKVLAGIIRKARDNRQVTKPRMTTPKVEENALELAPVHPLPETRAILRAHIISAMRKYFVLPNITRAKRLDSRTLGS